MRIHFIAIGGSVMHNLAISLARLGHQITGSDDQIVEPSKSNLLEAGLYPKEIGWNTDKISEDLDAIILGKHAEADNPELLKAQELGVKIYSFPEFIYEQSINKIRVVIAGTFGKTTIVSMIMHVLKRLGRDFDYVVGAQLEGFNSLIKLTSQAPIILIEGDEYYASSIDDHSKFHYYHPNIALISNVHWDSYKMEVPEDVYFQQFEDFIDTIVPKGTLVYNKEDADVLKIVGETKDCKINRHGYKMPTYTINKGITYLEVGEEQIPLKVIGKQNLSNIAGAYTVCEWLGIKRSDFYEHIRDFKSSIRYLEFLKSNGESVVYQDFAHTASKLLTSIHAVKEQFENYKLLTVIELNAYDILNEDKLELYRGSMDESDESVIFFNKNSIKEKNIILSNIIERLFSTFSHRKMTVVTDLDELYSFLEDFDSQGFNMLFMSSDSNARVNVLTFADKFLSY
ncbi:Mur ligase family protein [Sphingobacterium bovistauri]|uniref:Peptidoglycan synthetase n=1 Tax=Sphingobacterium bovistauri TaxID=2781959 RepID=A0ABS7Z6Z7_9SPHI|nr:Mur ligase family protein [Sphingobacterium bovistauri]MCA5005778.1 peptidoglycan synthetase [Sphingobacterium bovistauri]